MKYQLPFFKEIDLANLEEYYQVNAKHNSKEISIDLNFKGKLQRKRSLDSVKGFLEKINQQDIQNTKYILEDYKDENGQVKEYLEFHIEELAEELATVINFKDTSISVIEQLLAKLSLVRIGFYPDGKYDTESFAVFDYCIDNELSDQLIVVKTDENGAIIHLDWES